MSVYIGRLSHDVESLVNLHQLGRELGLSPLGAELTAQMVGVRPVVYVDGPYVTPEQVERIRATR